MKLGCALLLTLAFQVHAQSEGPVDAIVSGGSAHVSTAGEEAANLTFQIIKQDSALSRYVEAKRAFHAYGVSGFDGDSSTLMNLSNIADREEKNLERVSQDIWLAKYPNLEMKNGFRDSLKNYVGHLRAYANQRVHSEELDMYLKDPKIELLERNKNLTAELASKTTELRKVLSQKYLTPALAEEVGRPISGAAVKGSLKGAKTALKFAAAGAVVAAAYEVLNLTTKGLAHLETDIGSDDAGMAANLNGKSQEIQEPLQNNQIKAIHE